MNLLVSREIFGPDGAQEGFSLGRIYVNNQYLGYTCEDQDRHLEDGGEKVYGRTAIPRGRYKVVLSYSHRFARILPEVLDVPGFSGVRIHGGNTAADSLGCILVGSVRTANGCAKCSVVVERIIELLQRAEDVGEECWLEVK